MDQCRAKFPLGEQKYLSNITTSIILSFSQRLIKFCKRISWSLKSFCPSVFSIQTATRQLSPISRKKVAKSAEYSLQDATSRKIHGTSIIDHAIQCIFRGESLLILIFKLLNICAAFFIQNKGSKLLDFRSCAGFSCSTTINNRPDHLGLYL